MTVGNSGSVGRGKIDGAKKLELPEQVTISPEVLLAQLVNFVGEEFVVIPTAGWMKIVETLQDIDKAEEKPESIIKIMEELGVPVVPVSLAKKDEGKIITPNGTPDGESRIIIP